MNCYDGDDDGDPLNGDGSLESYPQNGQKIQREEQHLSSGHHPHPHDHRPHRHPERPSSDPMPRLTFGAFLLMNGHHELMISDALILASTFDSDLII